MSNVKIITDQRIVRSLVAMFDPPSCCDLTWMEWDAVIAAAPHYSVVAADTRRQRQERRFGVRS